MILEAHGNMEIGPYGIERPRAGGVIVLESPETLPEGIEVRVITDALSHELPTLSERFGEICGKAAGLPPDLAERHDHYLHGHTMHSEA